MGNNKPTDKLVVKKVFEMHAAGDSAAKIARSYPFENVWGYIKNIVQARMPQNLDELDRFVQEAFKEIITPEYCKKLYDSIPKRLNLVIKKKGFRIKY